MSRHVVCRCRCRYRCRCRCRCRHAGAGTCYLYLPALCYNKYPSRTPIHEGGIVTLNLPSSFQLFSTPYILSMLPVPYSNYSTLLYSTLQYYPMHTAIINPHPLRTYVLYSRYRFYFNDIYNITAPWLAGWLVSADSLTLYPSSPDGVVLFSFFLFFSFLSPAMSVCVCM